MSDVESKYRRMIEGELVDSKTNNPSLIGVPKKFVQVMNIVLPPLATFRGRTGPFIPRPVCRFWTTRTSHASGIHGGIDFNYNYGKNLRNSHNFFSPIAGTVINIGTVAGCRGCYIKDADGYTHVFFHGDRLYVKLGQSVSVGTKLGLMGSTGSPGANHVHYGIFRKGANLHGSSDPNKMIDPFRWWLGIKQVFVPTGTGESNDLGGTIQHRDISNANTPFNNQYSEGSDGTIASYRPRMAPPAEPANAISALLPNRIPQHEPWPRMMLVNTDKINKRTDECEYNTRLNPQFDVDSEEGEKQIGRIDGNEEYHRGLFWRR